MTKKNLTGKQLGNKVHDLFNLIETVDDWEKYVSSKTEEIVKTLYKTKVIKDSMDELGLKYSTIRSHLMRARERIKDRRVDYLRNGESKMSQQLFSLMEIKGWQKNLTDHEILLAKEYKKEKNFYQVARKLGLTPGNIAGTLYGNTQKLGVIEKIKEQL